MLLRTSNVHRPPRSATTTWFAALALLAITACGSDPSQPSALREADSTVGAGEATTTVPDQDTVQQTVPADTTTSTTTPMLPAPFERRTIMLDLGTNLPPGGPAMDQVMDSVPFYTTTFIPESSRFHRFAQRVGAAFEAGSFVSETLAVDVDSASSLDDLLAGLTARLVAELPDATSRDFVGFETDVTFGGQLEVPLEIRRLDLDDMTIDYAVAGPIDGSDQTFTIYISVSERHPVVDFSSLQRQPAIADAENALTQSWPDALQQSIRDWDVSIYVDSETGDVLRSLMFDAIFDLEAADAMDQLLATGAWSQHPDFPPDDQGFSVYSDVAWLQGFAMGASTSAVITTFDTE